MMPALISLLLDIGVAALLLAVIIYCRKLNRSIKTLQDSKSEMAKLFSEFDQSIASAKESVRELKESSKQTEALLREKLDTANGIADDLAFMIERGNKMADQLETGIKGGRSAMQDAPAPKAAKMAAPPVDEAPASPAPRGRSQDSNARRTASIESVLEQMANRNNPDAKDDRKPHSRIRSKAEQELFDSLKSGR